MFAKLKKFDWALYTLVFIFLSISIVIIYSITYGNAKNLALSQGIYSLVGIAIMFGLSFLNYKLLRNWSIILYLIGLAGLLVVMKLGHSQFGASRWIDLGIFDLQPSELFKLFIILVVGAFLASRKSNFKFSHLIYLFILVIIPIVLVVIQPDLGTGIVLFVTVLGMILSVGIKRLYLLIILGMILLAMPIVFVSMKPYQKERVLTFINPERDPTNTGYHITQAKITVGSGGLFGKGLGKGSQSELNFLPVAHTDFIFAGMGEVAGFMGTFILIVLYLLLFYRVVVIANNASDDFGSIVAIGVGIMLLFQFFINISMNIGLAPVVGVPLPFVSYGGNNLITNLMAIGILQNIYSYRGFKTSRS